MKRILLTLLSFVGSSLFLLAQESAPFKPISAETDLAQFESRLDHQVFQGPDLINVEAEDLERDKNGDFYRIAKHITTSVNLNNSGTWSILPNGDRVWRVQMTMPGAKGTELFFDNFYLPQGSRLHVYSPDRAQMIGAFTSRNNHESRLFATDIIKGESCIIEYFEPVEVLGQGSFNVFEFGYVYRSVNIAQDDFQTRESMASDTCEVDVKCPEGTAYPDQIRGVCRIIVKVGTSTGYCSGSAINNTNLDCTPYILTAQHCGVGASTADFNLWKFYFNYQRSACSSGGSLNNMVTGAALVANSNDVSGSSISKSDFILCRANANFPSSYNVYFNGWDRQNVGSTSGVSIHHPAGDYKKISTYTTTLVSSAWSGSNTHWRVTWAATVSGHGVTEGGSSGSPIFNASKLICGQLSGGSSYCTSPTAPDLYGKFSYNWISCGTTSNRQLKPWLDPANSGVTTLAGRNNTCVTGEEEYAIEDLFTLYPNPVVNSLTIESSGFNESVHHVTIFDQLGKLVMSFDVQPGRTAKTIQLDNLQQGVYTLNISNSERSFAKKFIKQ